MTMDLEEAAKILNDSIREDGCLYSLGWYLHWHPPDGEVATLDGEFTAKELEAIACWMQHHSPTELDPYSPCACFIPEPKKEGAPFGWWKPICMVCKTPLTFRVSGTNTYWSFQCDCLKKEKKKRNEKESPQWKP